MNRLAPLSLALLLAGLAGPALASPCGARIDAVDKRVKAVATEAISASTSGKGTAAAREGQGIDSASKDQPKVSEAPPEKSAEAGKGGDSAQQAKVAVDEARTAEGKGDEAGCKAALDRAEAALKAAP